MKRRIAMSLGATVALALATVAPMSSVGAATVHHPSSISGRLDTFKVHSSVLVDLKGKDTKVILTKKTHVYGHLVKGKWLNRGDKVTASVKWVKGKAYAKKLDDQGNNGGDNEDFQGTYETSTSTSITILLNNEDGCSTPASFTIDANTTYVDQNGNPATSLTYTSGEPLDITATQQSDGSWLATTISAANQDDQGGDGGDAVHSGSVSIRHMVAKHHDGGGDGGDDFQGTYQANDATTLTIMNEHGWTHVFTVDSNTQYFDQNGNSVPSLTYTTGEDLDVVATQQTDGTWLATSVSVGDNQGDQGGDGGNGGQCDNQGEDG